MRSDFDDELKNRLANYTKEPDEKLWKGITSHIPSKPDQNWKWMERSGDALTTLALVAFLYLNIDVTQIQPPAASMAATIESPVNQETTIKEPNDEVYTVSSGSVQDGKDPRPVRSTENQIHVAHVSGVNDPPETDDPRIIENQPSATVATVEEDPVQNVPVEKSLVMNSKNSQVSQASAVEKDPEMKEITKEEKEKQKEKEAKQKKLNRVKQERKHQKFDMYVIAMPTFGYQRIETNQNDNIIVESIQKIPAFSTNRLGFRVEVGAQTSISKRMKVFGGVLYYQRKQTIDYVEKQVDSTVVSSGPNGEILVEPYFKDVSKSFEYELKNIGLQMGLNYMLSKKIFLQTIGTGLEFQFALNKQSVSSEGFTNNPTAYVFYNFYYRLQYPSEGRLKAVFQPTLNYSFYINQDLNAPFYVKPYGLGLNIGLTYNF